VSGPDARDGPIWLVGAGNMGGAMLRGWIAAGRNPSTIVVIDPACTGMPDGVITLAAPPSGGPAPAVVVLAVKPQLLDVVTPGLAQALAAGTMLVSVLAGVEIASLRRRFAAPQVVVRAMPNLPAAIGRGVTALYGEGLDGPGRDTAAALVASLGAVEWIDGEGLFDAVTALSGCGPGFLFRFVEAMAEAGTALGLPADQALRLALATVDGSARMAAGSAEPPTILADRVASPGGSTREGLNVLDEGDALKALMRRTLAASAARNAAMAAAAR
jgi:pyrroline-5-carboxylate reductase